MVAAVRFTREELDRSFAEAMNEPALRSRILQHVARLRGTSTGQAHEFLDGPVARELGITAGSATNPSLGSVLSHIGSPHFDGPPRSPKGSTMSSEGSVLDQPVDVLLNDSSQTARLVRAVQSRRGVSYEEALRLLLDTADPRTSLLGRGPYTARTVLDSLSGGAAEEVVAEVRLLERRDGVWQKTLERESAGALAEPVDSQGRVLLDDAAVGRVLGSAEEFEARLFRIRRATSNTYDGPDGAAVFRQLDRSAAASGIDIVATAERPQRLRAAQAKAGDAVRRLDAIIAQDGSPADRLRLLEQEIARSGLEDATSATRTGSPGVMTLDDSAAAAAVTPSARAAHDAAMTLLERRGDGPEEYVRALDEVTANPRLLEAMARPAPPTSEPEEPRALSAPEAMHGRVLAQLKAEGLGEQSYPDVLARLLSNNG